MSICLRRREFVAGLGGAAAWPLAARAQQRERMRRIGVLLNYAADGPQSLARVTTLVLALQSLGWTVGRNVQIEYRLSAGDPDRIRQPPMRWSRLRPT
jgi:putative ABC transport system substrate-binding protein